MMPSDDQVPEWCAMQRGRVMRAREKLKKVLPPKTYAIADGILDDMAVLIDGINYGPTAKRQWFFDALLKLDKIFSDTSSIDWRKAA
jgi:hypothetical protein